MIEKNTSFHTICRLLLKEIRIEKGITQAHISQLLGKASTSSWSKVENGESPLTLEHLLTACSACQIWPSDLFHTVQDYAALLSQNNWYVAGHGSPLNPEEDSLSIGANDYYSSGKLRGRSFSNFPVLRTPWPYSGTYAPLDVFRFVLEPRFVFEPLEI